MSTAAGTPAGTALITGYRSCILRGDRLTSGALTSDPGLRQTYRAGVNTARHLTFHGAAPVSPHDSAGCTCGIYYADDLDAIVRWIRATHPHGRFPLALVTVRAHGGRPNYAQSVEITSADLWMPRGDVRATARALTASYRVPVRPASPRQSIGEWLDELAARNSCASS